MNLPDLFEKVSRDRIDVPYVIEFNDTLTPDAIAENERIMKKYLG